MLESHETRERKGRWRRERGAARPSGGCARGTDGRASAATITFVRIYMRLRSPVGLPRGLFRGLPRILAYSRSIPYSLGV
eukprot:3747200-Prymnesium_polylepis.1